MRDLTFIFIVAQQRLLAWVFLLLRFYEYTQTHGTRWDVSGRVIGPSHIPLPDNTQHSQETDVRAADGIRTRNPSKRAVDPRLSPRGHWDRLTFIWGKIKKI